MNQPIINIDRLTLEIDGNTILRDVSLDVARGEYLAVVGQNGAGKSSLIKCMARLHQSWRGAITIKGIDLRRCRHRETARMISYVPQAEGPPIPFTCFEFVLMARYPHLSPFTTMHRSDRELAEDCLRQTGTVEFRDRPMDTLSGGERQMVMIAAALAQGAEIMMLDEPTAFLDYHHQRQVLQLLGDLNRLRGLTVVVVSHDINSACRWCSRVAALRDGCLLFTKTPAETLDRSVLAEIYDTEFIVVPTPVGGSLAVVEDNA